MNTKVARLILGVFKNLKSLTFLLLFIIIGAMGFILVTPQVLKYIIDDYLILVKGKNLLIPALLYFIIMSFVGIFNFAERRSYHCFWSKNNSKRRNND